jgi:hypothetical protein
LAHTNSLATDAVHETTGTCRQQRRATTLRKTTWALCSRTAWLFPWTSPRPSTGS